MVSHLHLEHTQRYMFFTLDCIVNILDIDIVNYIKQFVYLTRRKVFTMPSAEYINKYRYKDEYVEKYYHVYFDYQNVNYRSWLLSDDTIFLQIGELSSIEICKNITDGRVESILAFYKILNSDYQVYFKMKSSFVYALSDDQDLIPDTYFRSYYIENKKEVGYNRNMIFVEM